MTTHTNLYALRKKVEEMRTLISKSDTLALQLMKHPKATANQIMEMHTHMVKLQVMVDRLEPALHKLSQSSIRPITLRN